MDVGLPKRFHDRLQATPDTNTASQPVGRSRLQAEIGTRLDDGEGQRRETNARATAVLEMLVREGPEKVWGRPKSRLLRMHYGLGKNRAPQQATAPSSGVLGPARVRVAGVGNSMGDMVHGQTNRMKAARQIISNGRVSWVPYMRSRVV
ncbi:uncharacterized protein H6S33_002791 [Morchella sextelata]|uniref:uncharacterized protein n=1 Tax=Morchella sextelata TaxID=1174677 RepID=UPI001D03D109|nr:uncharacterized protein H6S33_002791 [Morchella sextelata]KAH0607757.1 hypothetical protein H6S33_002791 [Morchella sextelata]